MLQRVIDMTVIGLAVLACAGPAWPAARFANDRAALPGRVVSVQGHGMYIHCSGSGSPTVVLDSGLGDSALVWSRVQPRLSRLTRVCSYDRAGYGNSAAGPLPRTSAEITTELRALLRNAGVSAPYVLVGHSFGGWNIQLFATHYPRMVAGLVLVDSSQANQIERYRAVLGEDIAPTGNGRFHLSIIPYVPPDLPPPQAARALALTYDPMTWHTAYNELMSFRTSEREVRDAPNLPDVPLVVISRGRPIVDPTSGQGRREALWRQLQQDFVDAHPGALHLIARDSGHYIQLEQPALVIEGVCLVLQQSAAPGRNCAPSTGGLLRRPPARLGG